MRTIKKYSNRRLYDTEVSSYINLDALAELIRGGEQIRVVDAKSGEDLTHTVLLQIILETQGLKELFPSGFLHRIIRYSRATGPQQAILQQVGVGMQMLEAQMQRFETQFGWMSGVGGGAAPQAASTPSAAPESPPEEDPPSPPREPSTAEDSEGDELSALRERLAALESRLGRD